MNGIKPVIRKEIKQIGLKTIQTIYKNGKPTVLVEKEPFYERDVLFRRPYFKDGYKSTTKNLETGNSNTTFVCRSTFPIGRTVDGLSIWPDVPVQKIRVLRRRTTANGNSRHLREFMQVKTSRENEEKISRTITQFSTSGKRAFMLKEWIYKSLNFEQIERIKQRFNPSNMKDKVFGTLYELIVKDGEKEKINLCCGTTYRFIPPEEKLPPDVNHMMGL